jgi:hypothetical protein
MSNKSKIDKRIDQYIDHYIDEHCAKFEQLRELLADPEVLALAKKILIEDDHFAPQIPAPNPTPIQQPTAHTVAPVATPTLVFRGLMTQTAYECVLNMNEPFTARELIEKMREAGYKFFGHPEVSVHTPLKKLLETKVIEIIEEGAGRHATVYQKPRKMEEIKEIII